MGLFDFIKRLFIPDRFAPPSNPGTQSTNQPSATPGTASTPQPNRFVAFVSANVGQPASPAPAPPPRVQTSAPPKHKVLNLDAAQFAPISSSDALSQARASTTVRANPWWGRLDTIPPASDERTLLIDRSLVAYGLMKPEELVEIHRIGDLHLASQGEQALARERARLAVAESEVERKRIKEQKKAEAAARKQKHADDVAHRKATDIVFLGRGVSRGLADRRANVEKLEAEKLPVLSTPSDVARAMGISIPRLRWLAFHSDATETSHYIRFNVPKKSGGVRELAAPHRDLAAAQRWIFQNILQGLRSHDAAHGFVRGRSVRTNALPHVGRRILINADLCDFFPTITFARVKGAFENLGYSPAVATILALLCTESPRRTVVYSRRTFHVATAPRALPQGACTSPALSNLIARRLDSRLTGISRKLGWIYTRYADDLSFSTDSESGSENKTGYLLSRIRHIAQDEGFRINEKKTRVLKQSAAMSITGVIVNKRPGVRRRDVRRLRAIVHNARKHGLESQNRSNEPNFEAQIRGKIAFVQMINPNQAKPLLKSLAGTDD